MKTIPVAAIVLGLMCLFIAVVEKFVGKYLLEVAPANYVHVASSLFLLAIAVLQHLRGDGPAGTPKQG